MGSHVRHRSFFIVDRTRWSAHLTTELINVGVSPEGARQLLAGEIVSGLGDRQTLARIMNARPGRAAPSPDLRSPVSVDPSDPSGNTIYVGTAGGGVWKVSPLSMRQFLAGFPVTNPQERQALAQIVAAALEQGETRTRLPWTPS